MDSEGYEKYVLGGDVEGLWAEYKKLEQQTINAINEARARHRAAKAWCLLFLFCLIWAIAKSSI